MDFTLVCPGLSTLSSTAVAVSTPASGYSCRGERLVNRCLFLILIRPLCVWVK